MVSFIQIREENSQTPCYETLRDRDYNSAKGLLIPLCCNLLHDNSKRN